MKAVWFGWSQGHQRAAARYPLRPQAAVLINPQMEPGRTRIVGPVAARASRQNHMKIISLAPRFCDGGEIRKGDRSSC